MKEFFQNNKSYILIILVILLSIGSFIYINLENKNFNVDGIELNSSNNNEIAVYISGEVINPGVYYLEKESRLVELIELCEGFTDEADHSRINLAQKLNDSDMIVVPKVVEFYESEYSYEENLVNINICSIDELLTLEGIGEGTAKKIIEYREENNFVFIEDIMNVSGIGSSKYEKIKEYICVD